MKIFKIVLTCLLTFLILSCSQDDATQKELAEIKNILMEINQKLGDSKSSNASINDNLAERYQAALPYRRDGANLEELDKISLPDNPTKNQVIEYIRKIGIVSSTQNTYSDSDPQVSMLTKIGNENLELLLKANLNHQSEFYATPAIARLAQTKDNPVLCKAPVI